MWTDFCAKVHIKKVISQKKITAENWHIPKKNQLFGNNSVKVQKISDFLYPICSLSLKKKFHHI